MLLAAPKTVSTRRYGSRATKRSPSVMSRRSDLDWSDAAYARFAGADAQQAHRGDRKLIASSSSAVDRTDELGDQTGEAGSDD